MTEPDALDSASSMPGQRRRAARKFFGVILLIFGLFFIIPSQHEINKAREGQDWRPRQAEITYSRVAQFGGGRADDAPHYRADIGGRFLDDGQEFKIEQIAFAQIDTGSMARDYVRRYPVGKVAEVFASPDDPTRVILVKGVPVTAMYLLQGLGALLVAGALILFWRARSV